jgi:N-acetylmuramoyl-L-alanine amidase
MRSVREEPLRLMQRVFLFISFAAVVGIVLIGARVVGFGPSLDGGGARQGFERAAFTRRVALISGHAGNDSGAVCEDDAGEVTLAEADVNAEVVKLAAARLRQAGADVVVLEEYDTRLDDLRADVLLSVHADSCIEASGFKAAAYTYSQLDEVEARLLGCINSVYAAETGLTQHPNTVTHNMTKYHAFRKIAPTTPAAILELGFLGGDRTLLEEKADTVAQAVADSVLCFLRGEMGGGVTPAATPSK